MHAVIFDLDGTIVFSHPTHFAAYEKLFARFGVTWDYKEFNDIFAGTGAPSIIKMILERNGIYDFDLPALVQEKRNYFDEILSEKGFNIVPGFFDFLKKINARGLKKAIASGASKQNIISILKSIGIIDEFQEIVSGEEVSRPKPAPDIFLEAARKIEVAPGECLVIEDTEHGINAAKTAGMKCVALLTTLNREILTKAKPDWIAENYFSINFQCLNF
ncbi:HAD family phosphatase [Candidatus Peregrinibacteria bacterium]|nr:HAD family phosphatase [Candidatus Peregrinibacteria bacterium]